MYLDSCNVRANGKVYTRVLLRQSYREDGKVKHRTIANLSKCSPEEIAAIKLAFEHKHDLESLAASTARRTDFTLRQGPSIGAVAVLQGLAAELGITAALGDDRQGKLALWQIIARAIDQGSRLSAVRLAGCHACCDLLELDAFNEDHLYANLAWLSENQAAIELRLFEKTHPSGKPPLFLYDVTSSYLEGQHNALAAFGYNRDGKHGKKQIVIGLLCDGAGLPLAIEVFEGNTLDPKTLSSQIQKIATRFGGGDVTLVGDRGMIKGPQIDELIQQGFHYITAITKPQIESLLKTGILQMELFDHEMAEIIEPGARYVLRRNPRRAEEIRATRQSKFETLARRVEQANQNLTERLRAKTATALKSIQTQITKLKLTSWVSVTEVEGMRKIELHVDEAERTEESKLDGCYVLKTDLTTAQAAKETVHSRYKDLALVEQAFRISKTVELEMRPIHVRCEASTRGHALVVMLAYILVRELARRWIDLDLTVGEGIHQLATLCVMEMVGAGKAQCGTVPQPRPDVQELIARSGIPMPVVIRIHRTKVATKKKLPKSRVKRS
jgi:transposase